jgi:hypothetical protein
MKNNLLIESDVIFKFRNNSLDKVKEYFDIDSNDSEYFESDCKTGIKRISFIVTEDNGEFDISITFKDSDETIKIESDDGEIAVTAYNIFFDFSRHI